MPALTLFNRRTMFAGDDLQLTSILTSFAHLAQFCLLVLPIFIHMIYEAKFILEPYENNNNNNNNNGQAGENILIRIFHYLFGHGVDDFYNDDEECNQKAYLFPLLLSLFLFCTTAHIIIALVTEALVFKLSCIGNPTQPELRNPLLSSIAEKKWIWSSIIGNIILLSLGFATLSQCSFYFTCRDEVIQNRDEEDNGDDVTLFHDLLSVWFGKHAWWFAFWILLVSQGVELFVSSFALNSLLRKDVVLVENYMYSIPNSSSSESLDGGGIGNEGNSDHDYVDGSNLYNHSHPAHHELIEEMWTQRCQAFCKCAASSTCYLFGGKDLLDGVTGDYGQVSRALADYFEDGGVLDIVGSDIVAGFMMLQRRQRQRVLAARREINDDLKISENLHDNIPLPLLKETESSGSDGDDDDGGSVSDKNSIRSASTISFDAHNFGNKDDRKMTPIIDHNNSSAIIDSDSLFSELGGGDVVPQYQNSDYDLHRMHSIHDDEMLRTISQPMSYTRTLLLPDNQYSSTNLLNVPTAAWTLKKVTEGGGEGGNNYQAQKRKVLNRNDSIDSNTIAEGARFARHALSIYTWVLYVYMKPIAGPTNLVINRLSKFCKQPKSESSNNLPRNDRAMGYEDSFFCNIAHGNTVGDNCFDVHRNSLLAHSGIDESDLIYANFNNKYNQMPYCIVIDHKWQSVVLAIRGTLSLEDCLVDVVLDPDPLDELGREYGFDGDGQYCHSGVVSCVKYILNDLKRHDILNSLLAGIGAPYSHYNLRITGHSLGGSCAALLGYILRPQFPNLRVVTISCPAILSWKLATECKDFVTTFVLDSDLVPRLTVQTMEQLRDEVLEMLCRIKVPKIQVVRTFILNGILRSQKETTDPEKLAHDNAQILHSKENMPSDTDFYRQVQKFKAIQKKRKEKRGDYRNVCLFPPGKMVHLVKIGERSTCRHKLLKCLTCCTTNSGYRYSPVYVNNDDFDEITITPTMGFDHFPNRICLELERVAEAFGIDTSLGSSQHDCDNAEQLKQNIF